MIKYSPKQVYDILYEAKKLMNEEYYKPGNSNEVGKSDLWNKHIKSFKEIGISTIGYGSPYLSAKTHEGLLIEVNECSIKLYPLAQQTILIAEIKADDYRSYIDYTEVDNYINIKIEQLMDEVLPLKEAKAKAENKIIKSVFAECLKSIEKED